MSLRDVRLRSDPRHDQQATAGVPKRVRAFDYLPSREAKRFPAIVNTRHSQPPCPGGETDVKIVSCAEHVVPNSELVVPSPVFCEEQMHDLGSELQNVVRRAAGQISAGMSIKAQQNNACDNLGYPRGHWRVRTAWYGYADNWNAKAVFDLLDRYNRYCRKHQAQPMEEASDAQVSMGLR